MKSDIFYLHLKYILNLILTIFYVIISEWSYKFILIKYI
jgi:hypothetical protein